MSGEKKFRSGFFGYKKKDVYDYIEKLAKDLEEQIKAKNNELENLKGYSKSLEEQVKRLEGKLDSIESGRTYIADAIIKAEQQAKSIIDNAVQEAESKKIELQNEIDEYNDKIEFTKKELRELRLEAIDRIKKYEIQIAEIVGSEDQALDEAAAAQEEDEAIDSE